MSPKGSAALAAVDAPKETKAKRGKGPVDRLNRKAIEFRDWAARLRKLADTARGSLQGEESALDRALSRVGSHCAGIAIEIDEVIDGLGAAAKEKWDPKKVPKNFFAAGALVAVRAPDVKRVSYRTEDRNRGEEVRQFARKIAISFVGRGAPRGLLSDPDDWEQTAAVAALEGQAHGARFLYRIAARREVAMEITRAMSPVHYGEHSAARAHKERAIAGRAPVDESLPFAASTGPDARIQAAERRRALREAVAHVARHVARMTRDDRTILEPLLGLRRTEGGEEADAVAWRAGIPIQAVDGAIKRLRRRVGGDRAARRAFVRVIEETTP